MRITEAEYNEWQAHSQWTKAPSASRQAADAEKAAAVISRKRRNNPEQVEQIAVMDWCKLKAPQFPELEALFAVPNHGKRSRIGGHYEALAGLRRGASDICLPIPKRGYGALFIEMKAGKNKATPDQLAFQEMQRRLGNYCCVAWGWAAAISVLSWYIGAQIVCRVDEKWEIR
jgi:hypothetical protein